jgi:mono/diheme cytochrome c family protein
MIREKPTLRILALGAAATAVVLGVLAWAGYAIWTEPNGQLSAANAADSTQIEAGRAIYAANCANCHGDKLQGQPNWKERKPDGKLPAPPHDATGHTWHHPDEQLFRIVKLGVAAIVPNYQTDMIGFADRLSDQEIWKVIAFIKSTWPADIQVRQFKISSAAAKQGSTN